MVCVWEVDQSSNLLQEYLPWRLQWLQRWLRCSAPACQSSPWSHNSVLWPAQCSHRFPRKNTNQSALRTGRLPSFRKELWSCLRADRRSYPLSGGQQRVQTLPVDEARSSGVRGQQPNHKRNLQLIVQWEPAHTGRNIYSQDSTDAYTPNPYPIMEP